ncbi:alkaline phosphatase family protein [Natrarchaeobius chitinivorans]|uniref:Nucleotide pyrophosphatase n=1 Tax=Natrarchaeobius chitinivorans TaxID=1679083 RepID=A0A3N6M1I0_NATCH|nr:alkaline phosphatase family protein [Natrarchaeobius chitinivorans]RQG97188.1 nucleotide pyrophosphatase [Natrarchaeobius chitinivorans]
MSTEPPRTVIIGLDALSFDYLDRFDLPHIQSIREKGVESELDSTFPPWTGSAWPSVYTGVGPDHHGVFSFFDFGDAYPDEAEVISRENVRSPAIWDYLTARDVPSAVLNVPVTHPSDSIRGSMIPGYLAPEDADGSPPGIREDLSEELGEPYRIYGENEADGEPSVDELVSLIDHRRRAARALLELTDWRFAFLQVQKTDTVFHTFDEESAFRRAYEAADEFVGTVLETVPDETNVIVCSDHGIGRTDGYNVYVNEVLRRRGLVETCSDGRTPTLGESKGDLGDDGKSTGENDDSASIRLVSMAESALRAVGLSAGDAYRMVQRVGADGVVERLLPKGTQATLGENVDWKRSRAYCRSGPELGVRINLEGRDAHGVVAPDEYESVRSEIVRTLEDLRAPDGTPAFEWVEPREAVYDGPYAEDACDVLFVPSEMNNLVATSLLGSTFVPIDKHNHKRTGVFIGAGPGFDDCEADAIGPLTLTDVAPITMALLEQPVPIRMQGTIPPGLLVEDPDVSEYGSLGHGGPEDDVGVPDPGKNGGETTENGDVVDRLENLGYL